ncbi:AraC family transcriptional regulator [Neotabrizicola sp. sgz301269]|uniref:AraC family transcriptional regulator n=1 Tax=Neotabrizicola sp. sgz301269 TaxID=3276282 RepID=UPI00376F5DF9
MADPLSQIIGLLQPRTVVSKDITGAGDWGVAYDDFGKPSFCAMMKGECRLRVSGTSEVWLRPGDFVLLPATPNFTLCSPEPGPLRRISPAIAQPMPGGMRHGRAEGPAEMEMVGGYFEFATPDARLLAALLPQMIHIRGEARLTDLVRMLGEEASQSGSGTDLVLVRLVEILLIQALRALPDQSAAPGLLRGLADLRLAPALRALHDDAARDWTVRDLAAVAGLSRSAFFQRFLTRVGLPPMEYLLSWRMALAKDLLRRGGLALERVAEQVGYGSAASFSAAFTRHVGQAPGRFSRQGG